MSGRRALTFLEQQPQVNADRLGVEGHSMGGRSTVLTAIDPRIKAAAPSVGGSGYLYNDMWGLPGSARRMKAEDGLALYTKVVSAQSYWPHIKAPTLFLGSTNDFNSPTEFVVKGMRQLPKSTERILVLAPHLNHRFTTPTDNARFMWMEAHLKGTLKFPKSSPSKLSLSGGIPMFTVTPDTSAGLPIEKVEIYYGYARDPRIRFWRSTKANALPGGKYAAHCHVFDANEPLFAFANITYRLPRALPARPGQRSSALIAVSSEYQTVLPEQLKAAGVKATELPRRVIDDFSRGWQDWYTLSADNPHHWHFSTRKIIDPSWMGPKGGELAVDLTTDAPGNTMAIGAEVNTWQGYTGRKRDTFIASVKLNKAGNHEVKLKPADFTNDRGEAMKDWDEMTEVFFTPQSKVRGPRDGKAQWRGKSPTLRRMYWVGGTYEERPHPHEKRGAVNTAGRVAFDDEFRSAIDRSVKLEEDDEKQ
jgi:hypothetical protein